MEIHTRERLMRGRELRLSATASPDRICRVNEDGSIDNAESLSRLFSAHANYSEASTY
jgi:hypothetical protein